jgi:phosphoglycolate phosphatase
MSKSITAVIFDLDGTLIDTAGEIATALERTFRELGRAPLPVDEVRDLIGRGVPSLVERALAKTGGTSNLGQVVERFEAHYAQTVGTASLLFPGVRVGLETLAAAGMPMAVVTNKPRFFTEQLLKGLGITPFFGAVVAGDDGIRRKPHGDMLVAACERMGRAPDHTLMLGDSDNDIVAARAAGCPVWCVPYGYNEGRPPEALACDRLVPTVEDAARLLLAGSEAGKT